MPGTITRFGGRIIEPRRGWSVITRTLRAYLDRELRALGEGLPALAKSLPELTVIPQAR
jgi:hypothetical protein